MARKPYQDRTDLEKVQGQWRKLTGLRTRKEWSAAIVRAATAAEISANFAIRSEFVMQSDLDTKFVDSLLRWANGLSGKFDHLLVPLTINQKEKHKTIKKLCKIAGKINKTRNSVVHQGDFCNEDEAVAVIKDTEFLIISLVHLYEPKYLLDRRYTDKHKSEEVDS